MHASLAPNHFSFCGKSRLYISDAGLRGVCVGVKHLLRLLRDSQQNAWMWFFFFFGCKMLKILDKQIMMKLAQSEETLSSHWPRSCSHCSALLSVAVCLSPSPARHSFHHDFGCPGLWALHSGGPCTGGGLPLGVAGHWPHLAVLSGLDWGSSAGVEPLHAWDPPAGLLPGLGIQGPEWCLLHSLLPPRLFLCACGHHDLLLRQHPLYSANGESCRCVFLLSC